MVGHIENSCNLSSTQRVRAERIHNCVARAMDRVKRGFRNRSYLQITVVIKCLKLPTIQFDEAGPDQHKQRLCCGVFGCPIRISGKSYSGVAGIRDRGKEVWSATTDKTLGKERRELK